MAAEEKPIRATVTNLADGPRSVHTATGVVSMLPGSVLDDYFAAAELAGLRATKLFDVKPLRGKAAEEAERQAPRIGAHSRPRQKVPGTKGVRMRPAKKK